ncbi:MAG: right-handed parallel beta-helix repeat-containing protein [Bacteroidales bacterium]
MKKTILLILSIAFALFMQAQTTIQDKQEVYGTWKKSKSPYIIEGEAIVPVGKTLVIKPGVEVKFKTGEDRDYTVDGNKSSTFNVGFLRVNGTIKAEGSKNKLIKFTRFGGNGYWGNIAINSRSSNNLLKYCWFEAAYYMRGVITETGDNATGAISFYNSTGTVENCLFINNGWTAFNCKEGSNPLFKNNTVVGNQYAIECNSGSSPVIKNTIIWTNSSAFYVNGESHPKISYSLIQGSSLIEGMKDDGNNIFGTSPMFKDQAGNNFNIDSGSPAYKKGENGQNIGAL